jgi:hypothetical protein
VSAAACGGAVVTTEEFERTTGVAAPVQPDPGVERELEARTPPPTFPRMPEMGVGAARPAETATSPAAAPIGFGDGAVVVATAFASAGGERLVEVVLYDGYGIVTTHEAATGDVDRVVVRGAGGAAEPARGVATGDAAASTFAAGDVDWALVPGLVERTPRDLGVDGGTVSHVIVEKNLPFTPDLVVRVYVVGARGGGRIDYFADGRPMRSFRD